MRYLFCFGGLVGLGFLMGCGDDDASDNACQVTCAPDEFALTGTLDGASVDVRRPLVGYSFRQDGSTGRLSATWPDNAEVEIRFSGLVEQGETIAATVTLDFPTELGASVGNCAAGDGSRYTSSDSSGVNEFEARKLSRAPFCGGAPVTGYLCGCIFSDF